MEAAPRSGRCGVSLDDLADMPHQVGGHAGAKAGLKARGGKVYKPFQSGRRGEREHEFYERVFGLEKRQEQTLEGGAKAEDASLLRALIPLIPRYFGVAEASTPSPGSSATDRFLVLEDLTAGRERPCVMDVKVGTRSYEPDASAAKVAYERSKFPLQETAGFRLQGIKTVDARTGAYVELNKHFGRAISSLDELAPALGRFLPSGDVHRRRLLLHAFLQRLGDLQAWFDQQQEAEFVASSLLFLYDFAPGVPAGASEREQLRALAPDIRLIDFAHVTRPEPPRRDEGVRVGLQTLAGCFRWLLDQSEAAAEPASA